MIEELKNKKMILTDIRYHIWLFIAISFILITIFPISIQAQDDKSVKKQTAAQQFVDEDGDGFNDLLPDSDGDGIPDMIDPDFKGNSAESLYMHRYMNGQTIEAERNQFQHMFQHGEQGQYGPNDSTGHGMHDGLGGGHHGGEGDGPDSGGQGGRGNGGQGGGGQGGNGDGGGSGFNAPESKGNNSNPPDQGIADKQEVEHGNAKDNQTQKPSEDKNGPGNQGGHGGRP
jgi:hypothetical protein